jgi:hypothetical protein
MLRFKLRHLGFAAAFLLATLVTAEGLLRAYDWAFASLGVKVTNEFMMRFHGRKYSKWMDTRQRDPYMPPYKVFANKGYEDPERMRRVFEESRLPASTDAVSYDFLLPDEWAEQTQYRIRINSLGFRGAERSPEKSANTKRVIVLGAYHPFGHGIPEEQAYPAVLERELNAGKGKKDSRYEVWNGGRHASTAIVALARLQFEIPRYKPDLLVLDYGFVDAVTSGDNFMLSVLHLPEGRAANALRAIIHPLVPFLSRTLLWRNLLGTIQKRGARERIGDFLKVMRKTIKLARDSGVPVVLVKQMVAMIPQDVYMKLQADGVIFIDADSAFSEFPATLEQHEAAKKNLWMREVSPQLWRAFEFRHWAYRLNYFQLNPWGHEALAKALAKPVRELVEKTAVRKK